MKRTYFTGQTIIPGNFEDPYALWAFDPETLSFSRVTESAGLSNSLGYIGDDLYFIRQYSVNDSYYDDGATLTRLDAETGEVSDIFSGEIARQQFNEPLFVGDRIFVERFQDLRDDYGRPTTHPENGIWVIDGTIDGTYQVPALQYEAPENDSSEDIPLSLYGDYAMPFLDGAVFWGVSGSFFGINGVWYTDGTLEGTIPLTGDVTIMSTGAMSRGGDASQPYIQLDGPSGPKALFVAETEEYGNEIWVTDGTAEGTHVIDLAPGADSGVGLQPLAPFGDQAVFIGGTRETGYELYITDGTAEGTRLLYEAVPGPVAPSGNDANFGDSRVFGDTLVFSWGDTYWQTDGTTEGTRKIFEDSYLEAIGAEFRLDFPDYASSLFLTDLEIGEGLLPGGFYGALEVGGRVYFTDIVGFAFDNSWHLFVSDGTAEGTVKLSPGMHNEGGDGQSTVLAAYGDHVLFMMSNGDDDRFYATNGTVEGTFELDMGLPDGVTFNARDRNDGDLFFWEPDGFLVFDDAPVSPGNDGIRMTSGGTLEAGAGDDRIEGSAEDDTITGGIGEDSLDGGAGTDTAVFAFAHSDAEIEVDGDKVLVHHEGETDELENFEIFVFSDTTRSVGTLLDVVTINHAPTGEVSISGTAEQGETLSVNTASLADADGLGELSYQWTRDGAPISGAISSSYMLSRDDVGSEIAVAVSYTDGFGTNESVTSAAQVAVSPFATEADDFLVGTSKDDDIAGRAGADTIIGEEGDDLLIGGDVADVSTEIGARIFRVYQATLDRAPDSTGYGNWSDRLDSGETSLLEVIEGFVNSPEFQATYGTLDNTAFVSLLYQNVLGRAPDATGLGNWVDRLEDGMSRAEVVRGFSESGEFKTNTNDAASAYVAAETNIADKLDDVFRLYQATLDRAPDLTGLENWATRLETGTAYVTVANGFVASPEFQSTYGALDNEAFVTQLYQNVLGRAPDATGLSNWTQRLEDGMSRAAVVQGFAQAPEFVANTEDAFMTFMRSVEGDTFDGGAGDDLQLGSFRADHFVFDAEDAGRDRVLQMDPWDTIELTGFGYQSRSEALAQFSEVGRDTVFADGAVSVVFANSTLESFDDVTFLL